jgi:hypothetical protein
LKTAKFFDDVEEDYVASSEMEEEIGLNNKQSEEEKTDYVSQTWNFASKRIQLNPSNKSK